MILLGTEGMAAFEQEALIFRAKTALHVAVQELAAALKKSCQYRPQTAPPRRPQPETSMARRAWTQHGLVECRTHGKRLEVDFLSIRRVQHVPAQGLDVFRDMAGDMNAPASEGKGPARIQVAEPQDG